MGASRTIKLSVLAGVLVLALSPLTASVAAAGGDIEPTGYGDGTLSIGQLAPQTGRLSNVVESLTAPVTMAIEEINGAGGVLGQPVSYSLADDGTNPEVAQAALEPMLEESKVDAIMGPATSGTMLGIIDAVRDAGVLDCSGSNTSHFLSTDDADGFYFRTAPPDELQAQALAKLVLRDERKRVAILARSDDYGVDLRDELKPTLTKGKGKAKIVADIEYDPDAANFDRDVREAARAKPDAVVLLGFETDGADVYRAMIANQLGPQQVGVYAADGIRSDLFAQFVDRNNPGAVAGIKGTGAAVAPAGVRSPFNEQFAATGIPPIFSAHYYDCTILTALAAEKAKSDDPDKMKDAFADNTRGKVKCNTYADCKQALDAKKTIQYEGASASFKNMNKFDSFQPRAGAFEVWVFGDTGTDTTQPPDTQIRIG
jgi:branched-chain amino acid transport system substrate-binding protein